jgi:hypothetical protein
MPPAFRMFHLASRVTGAAVDLLTSVRSVGRADSGAREKSSKVESVRRPCAYRYEGLGADVDLLLTTPEDTGPHRAGKAR